MIKSFLRDIIDSMLTSSIDKKSALPRRPYLMTSAIPAEYSWLLKVSSVSASMMTALG